jgi:septal ring factor EnvC (AmiA/AmiB activator)
MASRCSEVIVSAASRRAGWTLRVTLTALALAFVPLVSGLAGQTPAPQERDRAAAAAKRAEERLQTLRKEADALAAQQRTLLADLRRLELERQISVEQLAKVERESKDVQRQLDTAEAKAAVLAEIAAAQLPDIEARLVQLYKMGRAGYWRLLLSVDDLQAIGRTYRTVSTLNAIDRARVNEHYATIDALARERKTLQERATQLEALGAEAARARAAADRAVAARSALVASIDARRDLNAQLTGELQDAQTKLQASMSQIEGGRAAPPALALRLFQGDLPWPARGPVLRPFGRQPSSRFGTAIVRNGMEIGVAEGQPVRTVHEGTVAFADPFEGYGNLVIVDHGARAYSLYGYLGALGVNRGQHLEAQAAVGTGGRNPAGNPALYFELRVDGAAVDPLQWLKRQR